jgi:mannose-6-phosphate isomerase
LTKIAQEHPGDVGLLVALLMNHVVLKPGQALYLPAGNIHAYLSGLGVEVMAASDNVLRGGLTKKPIDRPELMQVLDFSELAKPLVETRELTSGLTEYQVSAEDFSLYRLEPSGANMLIDVALKGRAIAVCVAGEIVISTSKEESLSLRQGEAAYFADATYFRFSEVAPAIWRWASGSSQTEGQHRGLYLSEEQSAAAGHLGSLS